MHPIQELVAKNKVKEALDALINLAKEESQKNAAIGLKKDWKQLQDDKLIGIVDYRDESLRSNKIVSRILQLLQVVLGEEENQKSRNESHGDEIANEKTKILYVCANPKGKKELRFTNEITILSQAWRSGKKRDQFIEPEIEVGVKDTHFFGLLADEEPDILHISMHSSKKKGLFFIDRLGEAAPIDTLNLKGIIEDYLEETNKPMNTIILSACNSISHAEAVKDLAKYVIGMQDFIPERAALLYTEVFYDNVFNGRSVRGAHRATRHPFRSRYEQFDFKDRKVNIEDIPVLFINGERQEF
jgi:hypothetical protein